MITFDILKIPVFFSFLFFFLIVILIDVFILTGLDWNDPTEHVQIDRTSFEERWILFQTLPSAGSINLGTEGTSRRDYM